MEQNTEMTKIQDKVTYKFERYVTYADGESHTDVKIFTMDENQENFYDIHSAVYGWLRSAFQHVEAPASNFDVSQFIERNGESYKESPEETWEDLKEKERQQWLEAQRRSMMNTMEDWK